MKKDHANCSGCSLCLLACPVWRQTRDIRLTPHGRAKAIQHGATAGDMARSIGQCTLCGACEPACPEDIPLVDLMLELRRQQPLGGVTIAESTTATASPNLLLPGRSLKGERPGRIAALLGCAISPDSGADIALAIEAGVPIPPERLQGFLDSLRGANKIVVADGLLVRPLRDWLPGARVQGLGQALMTHPALRARLRASDLYVIEPRAFHADYRNLIVHYDALRDAVGLATNLDLQRLAIPTSASAAQNLLGLPAIDAKDQARWILEGRDYQRVVVEDPADCTVFAAVTDRPVVHLADL